MSRPTAVLLCPGRGSYASPELGFLGRTARPGGAAARAIALADAERRAAGETTVSELDGAERFRPSQHQNGQNAAELIYLSTMAHLEVLSEAYDIVAVAGNSLGWYTTLAVGGVLSVDDGWRLVRKMASLQQGVSGGQILTTCIRDDWTIDHEARAAIRRLLEDTRAIDDDHFVAASIHLGGHEVLAGTEAGVKHLMANLPKVQLGDREFPFRLAGHGPFHTALCHAVAERALAELPELTWNQPHTTLIDGCGNMHSPWSADPRDLLRYTATTQVMETYDFTGSVRTAIREFNPDVLLCAGPGESLRAPVGHVVIAERYRGVQSRESLFASDVVKTS